MNKAFMIYEYRKTLPEPFLSRSIGGVEAALSVCFGTDLMSTWFSFSFVLKPTGNTFVIGTNRKLQT